MFDSPPSPPAQMSEAIRPRRRWAAGAMADLSKVGWRGPRMVLPAALNLGISALAVPLISAVLTRSDHPADAIAGFAVAYG